MHVIYAIKLLLLRAMWRLIGTSKFNEYINFIALKYYSCHSSWSHVSEKPLNCDRCSMTFTSKSQFAIHIRTHTAGPSFECRLCGRSFIRDSYLIRHNNRVHRDNRINTSHVTATINSVAIGDFGDPDNSSMVEPEVNSVSQQQQLREPFNRSTEQPCNFRWEE